MVIRPQEPIHTTESSALATRPEITPNLATRACYEISDMVMRAVREALGAWNKIKEDPKLGQNQIFFSRTTEDSELAAKALEITPDDTVFMIAASGDQVLDALCFEPKKVVCSDLSSAQLNLTKLKLIFAKYLATREEFAAALGLYEDRPYEEAAAARVKLFEQVYEQADPQEKAVLADFFVRVRNGVVDCGKANLSRAGAQSFLRKMRRVMPETSFKTAIGEQGTPQDRAAFKAAQFASRLSKKMTFLAPISISDRIVTQSTPEHLRRVFSAAMSNINSLYEFGLANHPLTSHNFGPGLKEAKETAIPMRLRPENYARLHRAIQQKDRVDFVEGDMGKPEFWNQIKENSFSKAHLSSVPVYIDPSQRATFFSKCAEKMREGGLVYTCSHDLESPLPLAFSETYQPKAFDRKALVGDRPSNYSQELLFSITK